MPVRFGIIQRYVSGEVLRAFTLALVTLTAIFVLIMVMAQAAQLGLSPSEILALIPYAIPGTLPYSVPVSLLFAVTVVYGRIASDNEVIAIKTAGVSALTVLWPAFSLGILLSGFLLYAGAHWIPESNYQAKMVLFKNMEDMFYKYLKKDREINNGLPFLIKVRDVDGRVLIDPIFKHRDPTAPHGDKFDSVIQAKTARIHFESKRKCARVYLDKAEVLQVGNIVLINNNSFDIPFPEKGNYVMEKKTQEWTTPELIAEQQQLRTKMERERKRMAIEAAMAVAAGRLDRLQWGPIQKSFPDYQFWKRKVDEDETEKQLRFAISFGSLFFVLLGAPVGIRFARRDFLSAFITCFIPIILAYYPLMLLGVNLGKEGIYAPVISLWVPNIVLAVLSGLVLPPIMRH